MRKIRLITLTLLYLLQVTQVYGLQIKAVNDNQTVSAKISVNELTRIYVSGDRIQSTRGVNGIYTITKDERLGVIYIKVIPFYLHKPFNLFVTTELGHTYNLFLTPLAIPAETIELKPLSPSLPIADQWEKNSPYVDILIELMNDMINQKRPEGYAVLNLGKVKPKTLAGGLSMQLVTIYRGNHLQGEIWQLKNDQLKTLYLSPKAFYQQNVRAVSILGETLNCGDETYLYRVVDRS